MSNDRYADFRSGMEQRNGDPCMSGLKKEPRNNFKDWSGWDSPSQSSKKKVVDQVLPVAQPTSQQAKDWLDTL